MAGVTSTVSLTGSGALLLRNAASGSGGSGATGVISDSAGSRGAVNSAAVAVTASAVTTSVVTVSAITVSVVIVVVAVGSTLPVSGRFQLGLNHGSLGFRCGVVQDLGRRRGA